MTSLERRAFVAGRAHGGSRVDRFLVEAFAQAGVAVTRAELQRWIEHGRVTTAGRARKAADKLREGDVVEVTPEEAQRSAAGPDASVPFDVLHVDDAVVVVNKPPGVVVHPARGHESGTLVNGLLALGLFAAEQLAGDLADARDEAGHLRPGIVHRLDKGTSGVMVVARTGEAREKLKAQFQAHTIGREYEGICVGETQARTIATLHGRHPTDRLRFTSRLIGDANAKRAITHVRVLAKLGTVATHIACRLETGRTHQIRVHLAETGTPVLGDPLYGKPPRDPALRAIAEALGHQALHARLLAFVHPTTGDLIQFEVDPPPDFVEALRAIRAL